MNIQKLNVEEILNTFQRCDDLKRDLLSKIESFLQKEKWLTYKEITDVFDLNEKILYEKITESIKKELTNKILRDVFIEMCSFAIPSLEAIECICKHTPILEVGCGTGFWSMLLEKHGCDIVVTEPHRKNYIKFWTKVYPYDTEKAQKLFPDRTLLICWPYDTGDWQVNLLQKADKVIFIGEWNGCTGSDDFFKELSANFERIQCIDIPQWLGLNDALYILQRRK